MRGPLPAASKTTKHTFVADIGRNVGLAGEADDAARVHRVVGKELLVALLLAHRLDCASESWGGSERGGWVRESVDKSSLGSRKRGASAGGGQCVPWMAFWCTIFGGSFSALPLAAMAAESDGDEAQKKKKSKQAAVCGAACGRAALAGGRLRREGVPLCAAAAGWWRRVGAGWRLRRGARRKVNFKCSSTLVGCQPSLLWRAFDMGVVVTVVSRETCYIWSR